jgi:preprotein translocase subunit SecY
MVSAAEQLAKNANWGALAKATELKQRLLFVLGALLVYRLGTYIPVPGIDPHVWNEIFTEGRRHSRHVQHVLGRCACSV